MARQARSLGMDDGRQSAEGLAADRRKGGGGIACALQNYRPVPVLASRLVYDEGVTAVQDRVKNPFTDGVSARSAGIATEVICGVDPRPKVNWLGEPTDARGVRMTAVRYVCDAVEIHFRLERGRTDVDPDSEVRVGLGDVRVRTDCLVAIGEPRPLRCYYCVRTQGRPPAFALDVVGSVQDPWRDWPEKAERYAAVGMRECWRFDMTGECLHPRLQGFRLERGKYVALPSTGKGGELTIRSEVLGLDFRWYSERLQVKDPSTGRVYQSAENVRELRALEEAAERGDRAAAARAEKTRQMIAEVLARCDAVLGAPSENGRLFRGADLPAGSSGSV